MAFFPFNIKSNGIRFDHVKGKKFDGRILWDVG